MTVAERRQREKEQRREEILNAAERLFFSRGYDNVSMDEIASEIEMSKTTLYSNFKDKESLFFAVVSRGMKILRVMIEEETKSAQDSCIKLGKLNMVCVKFIQEYPDYARAGIYFRSGRFDLSNAKDMSSDAKEIIKYAEWFFEEVFLNIKNCIEDGTFRSDANPAAAVVVTTFISDGLANISPFLREFMETHGITMQELNLEISNLMHHMLMNTGKKSENMYSKMSKWRSEDLRQTKIKVNLSGVPQTSLEPLYGRAKISKEHGSLFYDAKAVELVEKIDCDFSFIDRVMVDYGWFVYPARAIQFDNKVKAFIKKHPHASIVNLGAGFETEFYRIDNGTIHWYDLDLPEIIEVRKQLIPETDRATYIAKSFLDPSWCQDIETKYGVFMIAGGLMRYFNEAEVRQFFSLLVDHLPGSEVVFEAESKSSIEVDGNYGAYGVGWSDDEPEKRDALQAEFLRAYRDIWTILPQDLKNTMFSALTIATKPQGIEWEDFEMWWKKLSPQEKSKAMSDFGVVLKALLNCKFPLEDANEMTTWDNRIIIVDQFPLFRSIPRDPSLSRSIRQFMDYTDEKGRIKIVHLRI